MLRLVPSWGQICGDTKGCIPVYLELFVRDSQILMGRRSIHVSIFVGVIFLVLANGISDRLISLESDNRSRRIFDSCARDINLDFDANESNGLSAAT